MNYDSIKFRTEFGDFVITNASIPYIDPIVPFEVLCDRWFGNMNALITSGLTFYSKEDKQLSFLIEWRQIINCLR